MPIDIISAGSDGDSRANADQHDSAPGVNRDCPRSGAGLNAATVMSLAPTEAPGRITRKARQYQAAIAELRAQGYTLAAICRSLAAAGMHVSVSTVRREAIRQAAPARIPSLQPHLAAHGASSPAYASEPTVARATTTASLPRAGVSVPCSAKDEAEIFALGVITNPLVRAKEPP
ncbi:hypothetical protein [Paucibacter sp. XJ19-41]|uniref:hypothetical protein n=1 Tax=Paucibacter sp. XJ19-41 TaxID=2927824 RepID=UPI00234B2FAF|nr:hypothetical protein [Paucibacter sp. XJ19-41]MDC6166475.1 hypothetical protein [Paucibacter sp. XJ19-41]